jgi:S1-C subfamily serine protease
MAAMDSSYVPDPASGETSPELGTPSSGENGGLADAGTAPELAPHAAVPQPWHAPATGWGAPAPAPSPWPHGQWGMPPVPGGSPTPPTGRRALGLAFGGALIAGGLAGALVMAAVGNVGGHPATSSSESVPSQQQPAFGNGGFGGGFSNPFGGSGAGSTGGSSSSGNANIDANSIAQKIDPALVDITSYMSDGMAAGTGMVITSGGEVLTNNHVIEGATRVTAQIDGTGKTYTVRIVGTDPHNDIALLQLQGASNLETVSIGDPSKVNVGDPIVAIGNALGKGGTPSTATGQVVAIGQTITATDDTGANAETLQNLIQVNADVQPGDSGGPLVDANGKVIGMDTAASTSGRGFRFRGVGAEGFAIPIDFAVSDAQSLRNGQGAPSANQTALLGVEIASSAQGQSPSGALVVGVEPGLPAESAGIAAGDTITSFGGSNIANADALTSAVHAHKPGDTVQVGWTDQNGQHHSASVTLTGQSAPAA